MNFPSADTEFPPTRTAALERLARFLPRARDYAARRNFDLGPGRHDAVSTLSPYLRHRLITEEEVLRAVLGRYSLGSVDKFVQEVVWRSYWKGWLELRPQVWSDYQAGLARQMDALATQAGLRRRWEAACLGETGIDAFDHWAHELAATGYLHNHARMWFASIWIFTLRLPWELGADVFLRHLLDGDPASNTLSWRWVAGLQTQGKHYVARASNIERYTEGRFAPAGLAADPAPLQGPPHPPRRALPPADAIPADRPVLLILHEDDLAPGWLFEAGLQVRATALLRAQGGLSPLQMSPQVTAFRDGALRDASARWSARLGPVQEVTDAATLTAWAEAQGPAPLLAAWAPTGPVAQVLDAVPHPILRPRRSWDSAAWPHATAGFFRFKAQIPALLGGVAGLAAV